jgi:hypothetical protein
MALAFSFGRYEPGAPHDGDQTFVGCLQRDAFETVWLKDHTQRNNDTFAGLMSFHNCLLSV